MTKIQVTFDSIEELNDYLEWRKQKRKWQIINSSVEVSAAKESIRLTLPPGHYDFSSKDCEQQ